MAKKGILLKEEVGFKAQADKKPAKPASGGAKGNGKVQKK
jgi:hypothetical protein